MNLLQESPFGFARADGSHQQVPFSSIVDPHWTDIWAPRADFRGAGFQFAIGVLQLAFAPRDADEWTEYWDSPPERQVLEAALAPYASAFNFDSQGPAFMQDFDVLDCEQKHISGLLIDSPGEKTVRDNLDHFVKRDTVEAICPSCAAAALFTLQINAPSGGVGHRVSLRGGGPLTSLLVPCDASASLWHKLWLNVLPQDAIAGYPIKKISDVLPWMAATRTSDSRDGGPTTPDSVNVLQAYWSMPRRVRLSFDDPSSGDCDLCHVSSHRLLRHYRTLNYGVNYTGPWTHPLTPYNFDPKADAPIPIKGQPGGIAYRYWLGLTLGTENDQPAAAQVVKHFNIHLAEKHSARLWCFGYDMDNMKARCWYDNTVPLHTIEASNRLAFSRVVRALLDVALECASLLNKQVKAARYRRPADGAADPAVLLDFWQVSEPAFYAVLAMFPNLDCRDEEAVSVVYRQWLLSVRRTVLQLFDQWAQSVPIEDSSMRRIVEARADLIKWLNAGKAVRLLWKIVNTYHKETV